MRYVAPRLALVAALAASTLLASAAVSSGESVAVEGSAKASAYGITVLVPGANGGSAASVVSPPDAATGGSLAYPADGSAVQAPSATATARTTTGARATASASADVTSLSLFGGEITLASASVRARASVNGTSATGDVSASTLQGLVVLGQTVAAAPGVGVPLGDWGQATVLEQSTSWNSASGEKALTASVLGLHVRLSKEHGGLPAGSEILVGRAEATAQPPRATGEPGDSIRRTDTPRSVTRPRPAPLPAKEPGRSRPELPVVRRFPPNLTPPLTAGGYVF